MKTKDIAVIGLLVALSFVLGLVKIPGTSIALDSAPAFLAVFIFKDYKGAVIGALGHLLSAAGVGFMPLGVPIHLMTAAIMFIMLYLAAILAKKFNVAVGMGVIFLINAFIAPLVVFVVQPFSVEVYSGLIIMLAPATIANLLIAVAVLRPAKGALARYVDIS
ncbi:ECF transporter S component [Erysipelotrichaceae bacterium OttesenSCG-928-M19]|nr:ECF transporter S component [Erysipelotrichaceae bacterium OttesenSCG-928-M19]